MRQKNLNFYFFKSLKNTNDKIKHLNLTDNPNKSNLALFTDLQTTGRGRANNIWISSKGDLTCSFLINQKLNTNCLGQINILVSSIVLKILNIYFSNIDFRYKWPNDIFIDDMKLAGLLIETNVKNNDILYFVIGIGINFIPKNELSNIKTISISDFSHNVKPINIFFELSKTICHSFNNFENLNFSSISNKLNKKAYFENKNISIKQNKKTLSGNFVGIDKYGSLMISNQNGIQTLSFGEVL